MGSWTFARRAICALATLSCAVLPAAAEQKPSAAASPSIQHVQTPAAGKNRPESCAADYHARFGAIAETELAAYREAKATIGGVDPALPGRLIFTSRRRSNLSADAARAVDAGETLARRQGRTSFARDANTRWIAERIREDLTDYLTQKPTPYLCAGAAHYLSTLRTYAAQGAPSPERLAQDLETQQQTASFSLDAAFSAMRPAPLPRFAPADRPGMLSVDGLRLAVEEALREPKPVEEPTRVAERGAGTSISESQIDPDLPPLAEPVVRRLESAADLSRAITALLRTAERNGFIADASPRASAAMGASGRPVLARLAALRTHFTRADGLISDPLVRPAMERALSHLEVLDYLQAAVSGTADPLSTAMHGTMDAIEAAHADACTCRD